MLISTKGRYALRIMIDLARHDKAEYVPLKEIAERQGMSEKYLEAIIKVLVTNKMVIGQRGKKGGYKLCREPAAYTAWDIISAVENDFFVVSCLAPEAAACERAEHCATLPMWRDFNENLRQFFQKYTLDALASQGEA